jgi:8-oxo-dGTP diphosphatase
MQGSDAYGGREGEDVRAAGGVVYRPAGERVELSVVHRPKYDDWSLPKGKLDEGESFEEAALREVEEETGLVCRLVRDCGEVSYPVGGGGSKTVHYWLMEPVGGAFEPGAEIDQMRWLTVDEALRVLSYEEDRAIVRDSSLR